MNTEIVNTIFQPHGEDLEVHFKVIENGVEGKEQFLAELTLTNNSHLPLDNNWTIYFNFLRKIFPASFNSEMEIRHINGDFFQLQPTQVFSTLPPKKSIAIPFMASYWAIKEIDAPCGFYIVYRDSEGKELPPQALPVVAVEPFTKESQLKRTSVDKYPIPTPASRFHKHQSLSLVEKNELIPILPTPLYFKKETSYFSFSSNNQITCQTCLLPEANLIATFFKRHYAQELPVTEDVKGVIRLSISNPLNKQGTTTSEEAYSITIDHTGTEIIGEGKAGVFYGIQSFLQLVEATNPISKNSSTTTWRLPHVEIKDQPQFAYRGLHLDVARNFHPATTIEKLLSVLSFYKLNKFHFHLTDDEGWRIEIPDLPELTEVGGRRGHTLSEIAYLFPSYGSGGDPTDSTSAGNGYYKRQVFIDLLRYAQERYIEVIPAIDFPGHARAAIKAMEVRYARYINSNTPEKATEYLLTDFEDTSTYESVQYWKDNVVNIGLDSTYQFIEKIADELSVMYEEAGTKLTTIHIGGDEVPEGAWQQSPACHRLIAEHPGLKTVADLTEYFIIRVNDLLAAKGIHMAGWEEIVLTHKEGKVVPNKNLLSRSLTAYTWNTLWGSGSEELPYSLANLGFNIVLANATNLYFDLAYDKDPNEGGYYWAGYTDTEDTFRFLPLNFYQSAKIDKEGNAIDPAIQYENAPTLSEFGRGNISGIQGQLWGETITSSQRLDYLLYPRIFALAERAWAESPVWSGLSQQEERCTAYQKAWNEFVNRIAQIELPRLAMLFENIQYRVPMPGAKVHNNHLYVNSPLPNFLIRYTTDGTEPLATSPLYEKPLPIDKYLGIQLKLFSPNGSHSSRTNSIKLLKE